MNEIRFKEDREIIKENNLFELLDKIKDNRSLRDILDLTVNKSAFSDYKEDDREVFVEKIKCINEELEGKKHPITGVKYERRIVDDGNGNKLEGVFPQFKYEFEANLSPEEYKASDSVQFNRANKQLKESVGIDKELASKFTAQQLEMIELGRTPRGYTWHHSEELGKLQLVETKIHDKTRHTGGKNIWGGGTANR